MKNRFRIFFITIFSFLTLMHLSLADEFIFNSTEIEISEDGNIITASEGTAVSTSDAIKIEAKKFTYNKSQSILYANSGIVKSTEDNIEIRANKLIFNQNLSIINATGNVKIEDLNKNFLFESQNISYDIKKKIISSESKSSFKDNSNNFFLVKNFIYTIKNRLIKMYNAEVTTSTNDVYKIEEAYLNLNNQLLIGKDISINFNSMSSDKGISARLKGNTISANNLESTINKAVFTTCKKSDDCPPWQFSAKTIKHDKKKKTIFYDDAVLKLYDVPVFYFPKFFHPDPTVKKQSGFLMPAFKSSTSLGSSFEIPYYHVISSNKDFTFTPRLYSNDKALLQSEYRVVNSKSKHLIDFGFVAENNKSSKTHFFSNTNKQISLNNFDESELNIQLERTSNDTYLKVYKIKSPLITEEDTLTSSVSIDGYRPDLSFNIDFRAFEDLNKPKSDRYEYVYPSYNLLKEFGENSEINGNFSLNSTGYLKNSDTNTSENVIINDLNFNSIPTFTEEGIKNSYNFLIKNTNVDASNSLKFKKNTDSNLASIIEYSSSYPLKKEGNDYNQTLKPMTSIRFGSGNTKDVSNEDKRIDTTNIFSLNRIGSNDTIESGASFTYGFDFSQTNKADEEVFGAQIANIFRLEENRYLPRSSNLGSKTSDIVGNFDYAPNNTFKVGYDFSLDENLKDKNFELINTEIKFNNFVTSFEYLNSNNTAKKESYLTNKTAYNFNSSSSIMFENRKNKKTNITEFYNLIYQYRNDCLAAAIEYNKDFYNDGELEPEENIFFKLTIIPFGRATSPNFKK